MPNYFFHPLGDYAQHYINNDVSSSAFAHTRGNHGLSKMDFGVGGGLPVYAMFNGTIVTITCRTAADEGGYVVVIKSSDNGYSRTVAQQRGGSPEDYPLFLSYLEFDYLSEEIAPLVGAVGGTSGTYYTNFGTLHGKTNFTPNQEIKMGTRIGYTNSRFLGSNVHIDIGAYDRYDSSKKGSGVLRLEPKWDIGLGNRQDAYLNSSDVANLSTILTPELQLTGEGIIQTSTQKYLGVKSGNSYYPSTSYGTAVTSIEGHQTRVEDFYEYSILTQTPTKIEASPASGGLSGTSYSGKEYDKDFDLSAYMDDDGVNYAIGICINEVGNWSVEDDPSYWGYMEYVGRVARNRAVFRQTYDLAHETKVWQGGGVNYDNRYSKWGENARPNLRKFLIDLWQGRNYYLINDLMNYTNNPRPNPAYSVEDYLYYGTGFWAISQGFMNYTVGTFRGTNGTVVACWMPTISKLPN